MEAALRKAFASWARGPAATKVQAQFAGPKPGVYFIPKDDVNQSNIVMGHLGTTRDNPDFYALEVMNEVFGGGFSSRLFSSIRSKKGLAYGVFGGVGAGFEVPGVFQVGTITEMRGPPRQRPRDSTIRGRTSRSNRSRYSFHALR